MAIFNSARDFSAFSFQSAALRGRDYAQVVPGEGREFIGVSLRSTLPSGPPIRVCSGKLLRVARQLPTQNFAHHGVDAQPTGFAGILHEAVIGQ